MYSRTKLCIAISAMLLAIASAATATGQSHDPFATSARARVFLFVRTDCPISNRYAPELQRIAEEFKDRGVEFWLVYPDASETDRSIQAHIAQYAFPGIPLRDLHHDLVRRAHASVTPEAAVFDSAGRVMYHGRIDDRYVDFGKARPAPQSHDLEDAITAVLAGKPVAHAQTRAIGCSLADVE
jgi:AhpC/TSA family